MLVFQRLFTLVWRSYKNLSLTTLTFDETLKKLEYYCAYQERSKFEVRSKLKKLQAPLSWEDKIIQKLEKENFINEYRFACLFTSSKFRLKKWGRLKISSALRERKIDEKHIQKALKEIGEKQYLKTVDDLIISKQANLSEGDKTKLKERTARYLLGKGYESSIVWGKLNK